MGSRLSDEGRRRSAKQYKKGRRRKKKSRAKGSSPIRVCPDCDAELPADQLELHMSFHKGRRSWERMLADEIEPDRKRRKRRPKGTISAGAPGTGKRR